MAVLGVSYPVAAHLAVLSARPAWIAVSIALLVLLVLFPALRAGRLVSWGLLLVAGAILYVAAVRGQALLLLFLPPILINGLMAWVFGHTLGPGRMPLIERIIHALHGQPGEIDAAIVAYARRLTLAWAVLFATLTAVNFALAALAVPGGFLMAAGIEPPVDVPLSAWSLFANVLNYAIVGTMFAVEYGIRRKRFPQQTYRGFLDFLRKLAGVREIFRPTGAAASHRQQSEPQQP